MPGVRLLVVVQRTRTADPGETPEINYYLSSIAPEKGCAKKFASLLRGHWAGSENRNHWVRDHCLREDRTRLGSYGANCVLAGLRVCLLVIKNRCFFPSSPGHSSPNVASKIPPSLSLLSSSYTLNEFTLGTKGRLCDPCANGAYGARTRNLCRDRAAL